VAWQITRYKQDAETFPGDEAKDRFNAAVRGARIAGHKSMESLTRKTVKAQSKKGRKVSTKSAK
jgi:hypothetical protein